MAREGPGTMRYGIISDTHDHLPRLERALAIFQERGVDAVIHLGDIVAPFAAKRLKTWNGPLHVIYGNNDGERRGLKDVLPQIQDGPLFVEADGRQILTHHFIDWCSQADVERADIILTGHTHEVVSDQRDGKLFLNPGECCGWVSGRATVAILDAAGMSAEIIEVMP
jgi:putative phosphoesterase